MVHLRFNGLVSLLLPFLVTMKMVTNRAGYHNICDNLLIIYNLTFTINSLVIAIFSVRGEDLRFFDFSDISIKGDKKCSIN